MLNVNVTLGDYMCMFIIFSFEMFGMFIIISLACMINCAVTPWMKNGLK